MHLKQLKLAGFKSFVEPTVVPFSSQLVAVVGPNGCGKSNIIDAVRWVMGESSAKNLRGESMVDVIFNGATNRKPVGQASVELIFDNSLGRLSGQYAGYQEIAVKRFVTRDGDSHYYLNGGRCRRRDITDIFLGTGAGSRGYSIIGQNTISKLVEAHPEDLRVYLEEAAGVSKYKERRRETLLRISHTRENLVRVADLRDELSKYLSRLERQAKAAVYYKSLKQEEQVCKAEIQALKWRTLTAEQDAVNHTINELSRTLEQHRTILAGLIKDNVDVREKEHEVQQTSQQVQDVFYQLRTEIVRLEESIQQQQREKQRLLADKEQLDVDLQMGETQLQQEREALASSEQRLIGLQADLQQLKNECSKQQTILDEKQKQKHQWDAEWQQAQTALSHMQRDAQVQQLTWQHAEQRYQQTQLRYEKMDKEQSLLTVDSLHAKWLALQAQYSRLQILQQTDAEKQQQAAQKVSEARSTLASIEQLVHQSQDKVQSLATEHAAMLTIQNVALSKVKQNDPVFSKWAALPRLAEVIQVPECWMPACELVLSEGLQAVVLDRTDALWSELGDLQGHSAVFVQAEQQSSSSQSYPRLVDKLTGVIPRWRNAFDNIYAADHLAEALTWLPTLSRDESIVTMDGYWIGHGWVRVGARLKDDASGILRRQQALVDLKNTLMAEQTYLSGVQNMRDQERTLLVQLEQENDELKNVLLLSQDALRTCETELNNKQHAFLREESRLKALTLEKEELQLALEEQAAQNIEAARQYQVVTQAVQRQEQQCIQTMAAKTRWDELQSLAQQSLDSARASFHQAELQYNREALTAQQLRDGINREQRRIDTWHERMQALVNRMNELTKPDDALHESLHEKISHHDALDNDLAILRQSLAELQKQLRAGEQSIKQAEQHVQVLQENIQLQRLHGEALMARMAGIHETLAEFGTNADALLGSIPADATVQEREELLIHIEQKVKRLGAINLVAIEEYETESERKQQLDAQYQDLTTALETLDAAIAKMDKETKLRFKDTFEQVNLSFQSLFPRLFGGGRARLELTCDNLLDAGVLVMAEPPGKRNSTIHLLSGGEKAMTAVALIFAIFQQNPSPFCMLDEVDAPLDDLNVRRFCDLVKEMSQYVQFLFITHNKLTMELADQLIGVTMREPGISRVVAVDVVEALSMTAE